MIMATRTRFRRNDRLGCVGGLMIDAYFNINRRENLTEAQALLPRSEDAAA